MSIDYDDIIRHSFPLPSGLGIDSLACHEHRIAGRLAFNEIDYAPAGAGNFFGELFTFTGLIEIKALYGEFTEAAGANGPSHVYFTVDDGAAGVSLTSGTPGVGGVDCTSAPVGSIVLKAAASTSAAIFLNSSQCRYNELTTGGSARPFFGGLALAKPAATNHVRVYYTVGAAEEFSINWTLIWACRYPGSLVVAA